MIDRALDPAIRRRLLGCAAVSHYIEPSAIAGRMQIAPEMAAAVLFSEVKTELDAQGVPRWVLRSAMRRRILVDGRADIMDWLSVAGDATTDIGRMLYAWLRGELDPARAIAEHEEAVRRVACWLSDCGWVTPQVDVVLR